RAGSPTSGGRTSIVSSAATSAARSAAARSAGGPAGAAASAPAMRAAAASRPSAAAARSSAAVAEAASASCSAAFTSRRSRRLRSTATTAKSWPRAKALVTPGRKGPVSELLGREERRGVRRPRAPERRRAPGDVLERIAQVDELPVEDAGETRAACLVHDEEVAEPVVAVHERDRIGRGRVAAAPEERLGERRRDGEPASADALLPARELVLGGLAAGAGRAQELEAARAPVDGVQARERTGHLGA